MNKAEQALNGGNNIPKMLQCSIKGSTRRIGLAMLAVIRRGFPMPGFAESSPWMLPAGFDETKSAQIAAYLVQQVGEPTDKLKLIKLVYLSEREYLDRYSLPMTLDEFYSFKDGPVASAALNGINGQLNQLLWDEWIQRKNIKVTPRKKRSREEFNHLSNADISVLDKVLEQFGHMTTSEIWNYVHTKCPEYQEVKSGRIQIQYSDIFRALEKDHADEMAANIGMLRREAAFL